MNYVDENREKIFLLPNDAKEIYLELERKNLRFVSVLNTVTFRSPMDKSGLRFFAELQIKGKLTLCSINQYAGIAGSFSGHPSQILLWFKQEAMSYWILTEDQLIKYLINTLVIAMKKYK